MIVYKVRLHAERVNTFFVCDYMAVIIIMLGVKSLSPRNVARDRGRYSRLYIGLLAPDDRLVRSICQY